MCCAPNPPEAHCIISDNAVKISLELENDEIGPGFCASQRGEEPFYILGPDGSQYINPQFTASQRKQFCLDKCLAFDQIDTSNINNLEPADIKCTNFAVYLDNNNNYGCLFYTSAKIESAISFSGFCQNEQNQPYPGFYQYVNSKNSCEQYCSGMSTCKGYSYYSNKCYLHVSDISIWPNNGSWQQVFSGNTVNSIKNWYF